MNAPNLPTSQLTNGPNKVENFKSLRAPHKKLEETTGQDFAALLQTIQNQQVFIPKAGDSLASDTKLESVESKDNGTDQKPLENQQGEVQEKPEQKVEAKEQNTTNEETSTVQDTKQPDLLAALKGLGEVETISEEVEQNLAPELEAATAKLENPLQSTTEQLNLETSSQDLKPEVAAQVATPVATQAAELGLESQVSLRQSQAPVVQQQATEAPQTELQRNVQQLANYITQNQGASEQTAAKAETAAAAKGPDLQGMDLSRPTVDAIQAEAAAAMEQERSDFETEKLRRADNLRSATDLKLKQLTESSKKVSGIGMSVKNTGAGLHGSLAGKAEAPPGAELGISNSSTNASATAQQSAAAVSGQSAPVNQAQAQQAEVARAARTLVQQAQTKIQGKNLTSGRLSLTLTLDDGPEVKLLISPKADGAHEVALVAADAKVREELRRALPEIETVVAELPLEVSDLLISEEEPSLVDQQHHTNVVDQEPSQGVAL